MCQRCRENPVNNGNLECEECIVEMLLARWREEEQQQELHPMVKSVGQ
jgi:hypothetical protein